MKKLTLTKTTETRVITTKQVEVDPGFVARHRVVTKVQASTLTREWPYGPRTSAEPWEK